MKDFVKILKIVSTISTTLLLILDTVEYIRYRYSHDDFILYDEMYVVRESFITNFTNLNTTDALVLPKSLDSAYGGLEIYVDGENILNDTNYNFQEKFILYANKKLSHIHYFMIISLVVDYIIVVSDFICICKEPSFDFSLISRSSIYLTIVITNFSILSVFEFNDDYVKQVENSMFCLSLIDTALRGVVTVVGIIIAYYIYFIYLYLAEKLYIDKTTSPVSHMFLFMCTLNLGCLFCCFEINTPIFSTIFAVCGMLYFIVNGVILQAIVLYKNESRTFKKTLIIASFIYSCVEFIIQMITLYYQKKNAKLITDSPIDLKEINVENMYSQVNKNVQNTERYD